ncbi:hypothetical protein [Treponema pedis]|uniref:hypothetical protein n=1 Tax=Treponema pedis TaxID=409322 RepID=UPI00126911A1|nr:hypothetical protein [Treponema pedis]
MLYIILGIIVICVVVWLIKKICSFVLKILSGMFKGVFVFIYIITVAPVIVCTKIFHGITKILHLQGVAYYLLGLCSFPSFIYLCLVHIPYSKKERFINSKDFFAEKKSIRNNTIAVAFFTTFAGILFFSFLLL